MTLQRYIQKLLATIVVTAMMWPAARAQVYIQTTLPATGLLQKNQLWNLVLVNGTAGPMEGRLTLVLRDRLQNSELMTATTGNFTLPKGALAVTINNLGPVQYNYVSLYPGTGLNSLLPAGAYIACYAFARQTGERLEQVAEECVPFDVEPLSPPMLIFPADSALLDLNPAQFTWTPPVPAGMINRLQYEILITEIRPGQKPAEAIQQNMPFYSTGRIPNNFITYPAALPAFEKEKWYSWQVVARDEKAYAGKSEVWVFSIKKESPVTAMVQAAPFIKMQPGITDIGIAPQGILKLSFFNHTADSLVQVAVYDLAAGAAAKPAAVFPVHAQPGENQVVLQLDRKMKLSEKDTYKAEIVYSSGQKNSVLFRVKFFTNQ